MIGQLFIYRAWPTANYWAHSPANVTADPPLAVSVAAIPAAAVQTTQDYWPIIYLRRLANGQLLGPQSSQCDRRSSSGCISSCYIGSCRQTTLDVWPIGTPDQFIGSTVKVLNFLP